MEGKEEKRTKETEYKRKKAVWPSFQVHLHSHPPPPSPPHESVAYQSALTDLPARIRLGEVLGTKRVAHDARRHKHSVLLPRELEPELPLVRRQQPVGTVSRAAAAEGLPAGGLAAGRRNIAIVG